MVDYDYLILSANEFESFARDILQKKLSVFIESFTAGRDGGVDLRYATCNGNVIIQAKRYKDFNSLYSNLIKEKNKLKGLSFRKYIIITSVGLTPSNKNKIMRLFNGAIDCNEDIIGKNDLDNLLGQFPDIERKYFKLWLTSTNILEKVLHSKIYNQTLFELEYIKDHLKLYVQNESLNIALKILKKHKYVIISGIPGIGKTTLGRMLVLILLSQDYDEFVYLDQSIDDGYKYFDDAKKQIFLFDDFLGKKFFDSSYIPNEDNKIVKFIEKIKRSPNKLLIFTTREYILKQAETVYEAFAINNIDIAKCVLDLSSYTNIIKAQIIYNHLFFANVPETHLTDLIRNKNYLRLVYHQNYNPRIIETVINRKIWDFCTPDQFSIAFL